MALAAFNGEGEAEALQGFPFQPETGLGEPPSAFLVGSELEPY